MGRGGEEFNVDQLLYGKLSPLRSARSLAPRGKTIFSAELLDETLIGPDSLRESKGSVSILARGPDGQRRLFLSRNGQSGEIIFPDDNYSPAIPQYCPEVQHQAMDKGRDLFAWRDGEGWGLAVSASDDDSPPRVLHTVGSLGREAEMALIEGYPHMAWFELREEGDYGLCLYEGPRTDSFDPEQAVASYPVAIEGQTRNIKAAFNPEEGEVLAAWSEMKNGRVEIKLWSSNVLNGEGRRLFLYRPAPKGIDQQLFLPQCHVYPEPTDAVMHEQLGDSRDMLAWREEGGQWIVSANTINGEYMASNSTNVADRDVELTTIRGYPRMAWIELRGHGENGFVLVESDKNEPWSPAMAVSSYPTAVHGEPGNVRAIYNSENDEIIAAWSENQAGVAIIRIWSSVSGDSVISLESQLSPDDPRDIEIHEILEREAGPAVVWSPRGKKAFAVAGTGGRTSELFTGGVQPQFDVLEDDRLVFAHQWGGDLMIGEVPDHGRPTMTATVPGVEEAQIFGGERIRAVYRASGKNPGIFQLEEDGSSRAIPGTRQAHILSAGKDSRGQDVAWLLDHSGSKPEIRKLAVR